MDSMHDKPLCSQMLSIRFAKQMPGAGILVPDSLKFFKKHEKQLRES